MKEFIIENWADIVKFFDKVYAILKEILTEKVA